MKELIIKNSTKVALVDDEDYSRLLEFNWFINDNQSRIYRNNKGSRRYSTISLAVQIMNRRGVMFDHIDRNPFNNQKSNLRETTIAQNAMNKTKQKSASSQYKGVCWDKVSNAWRASIRLNGKLIHLGLFTSEIDAAKSYDKAAVEFFKAFANLNFK